MITLKMAISVSPPIVETYCPLFHYQLDNYAYPIWYVTDWSCRHRGRVSRADARKTHCATAGRAVDLNYLNLWLENNNSCK